MSYITTNYQISRQNTKTHTHTLSLSKMFYSLKLNKIDIRRFQPIQSSISQLNADLEHSNLRKSNRRYQSLNNLTGKKSIQLSSKKPYPIKSIQLPLKKVLYDLTQHLSYDELMAQRQNESRRKRLSILSQVIRENVKKNRKQKWMKNKIC